MIHVITLKIIIIIIIIPPRKSGGGARLQQKKELQFGALRIFTFIQQ